MTHYAALDVSLRSVHICVIDTDGKIKAEAKLSSEVEDIRAYLDGLNLEITAVGFEAGTLTQYLDYGLKAAGFKVVCMEARQVKAAFSAMRNKTDKHDARGIAQILRSGWYSPVYVKSLESHHIRALLSSRKAVLAKCIDLENEIRGLFKIFGIKLPPRLGHGSFDRTVRETIETDPALSHALLPLLDVRLDLYRAFRELDTRTRKIAHADEICRRLMTAPGVGFVTALTFKAAVDDPARFKRSRTLAAHFGLTPRRVQSGELNIEGHISRCGDRDVRSALYTAANTMMTRSSRWSSLKAWGIKLAKQRGHRRTVIAVARKLAVILYNGLTAAGFTVVCLETHHVKEALKAMRNKTDRNDARGIAQLLRSGWYRPVHVKSLASHEIRALLCSRRVILKQCIDFKAGVDDPTRFKHSRLVAAHFGLTPKREQSGEMAYDGHISRKGDAEVRCALYVAAHALLTRQKHASALKA